MTGLHLELWLIRGRDREGSRIEVGRVRNGLREEVGWERVRSDSGGK